METLIAVVAGVALAAACGFRVFVPLLVASVASASGQLTLAPDFVWIGTWPAIIALSVATVAEIGAYQVPWLDHALDVVAGPSAIIAGVLVTASFVGDMEPWLRWTTAVIAGGGAAGVVAGGMAVVRGASTMLTGGLGNPFVAAAETSMSVTLAALAVLAPVVALVVAVVVGALVLRRASGVSAAATAS